MEEKWLSISGFENYEVSNFGRVRSSKSGSLMIIQPDVSADYPRVRLFFKGGGKKGRRVMVHRVVAQEFIGMIPEGYEVNHKNGIKADASLENLEIITRSENHLHAYRVLGQEKMRGSRHGRSRLTEDQVTRIVARKSVGMSQKDIAKEFGVCEGTVSMILTRRTWRHVA